MATTYESTFARSQAIFKNVRFETAYAGRIPEEEPECRTRACPPSPKRFGVVLSFGQYLKWARDVAQQHHEADKEDYRLRARRAKREAWLKMKKLQQQQKEEFEKEFSFAGDELFPPIVNTFDTYAEVLTKPQPDLVRREKIAVDKIHCDCRLCTKCTKFSARIAEKREIRLLARSLVQEEYMKQKKAFNRAKRLNKKTFVSTPEMYFAYIRQHPYLLEGESSVDIAAEALESVPLVEEAPMRIPEIRITRPSRTRDEWDAIAFEEAERYNAQHVYRKTCVEVVKPRCTNLLGKLRAVVSKLRIRLPADDIVEGNVVDSAIEMQPLSRRFMVEMANDEEGGQDSQASNVILQEAVPVEAETLGSGFGSLRRYCATEETTVKVDQDRWLPYDRFTWSTNQDFNVSVAGYRLPKDAMFTKATATEKSTLRDNVLVNEMRIRQYMASDMVVRVQVNATPFHQGQLILGWFYQYELDAFSDRRLHPVCLSQTLHTILDVATSGSVELTIPYRNYRSYLNIYANTELAENAYLGLLSCRVLSPLKCVTGSSSTVSLVASIRFENCVLTGMIPPTIKSRANLNTEMFATLAGIEAIKYLRQYMSDKNRDQPPCPQQPPHLIPIASGSLATGRGDAEAVIPMRLDAIAQTPHPDANDVDFSVRGITSVFSYVYNFQIKSSDNAEKRVACFEAGPVWDLTGYHTVTLEGTTCYYFPPLAVISQLYAYWRGDIEVRLDFVATRFHQMRLWICWVPGYLGELTYEEALSCAGTMFDMSADNRSTIVRVPYIADKPWWSHRYANGVKNDIVRAPSHFCIYIVNPLMYNVSCAKEVQVNVYVRGADNFELAIPCQPSIGLSFYPKFKAHTDEFITAYPGYFPWYLGTWRSFEGGQLGLLRYGPGSDHIAQFESIKPRKYYTFKDTDVGKSMTFKWGAGTIYTGNDLVFVGIDVGDGFGLRYLGAILQRPNVADDVHKLRDFFCKQDAKTGKFSWRDKPDYDWCVTITDTASNTYYNGTINEALVATDFILPTLEDSPVSSDFEHLDTEAPGPAVPTITFEQGASTAASMDTFGESHMDLKDLCRRYQLYQYIPLNAVSPLLGQVDISFPIVPQGLQLQPDQSDWWNLNRDGIIPILLSAYRFYRGGLRFKFLPSVSADGFCYAVQVRPDRIFNSMNVMARSQTVADSVMQHGYAMAVQSCAVNPILTVEVPFYIPGNLGILQRPSDPVMKTYPNIKRFFSLGEMCVSVSYPKPEVIRESIPSITTMYAFADDFSPYQFQGFPPMCLVQDSKLDG